MKKCYGTAFRKLDSECKVCGTFSKCYEFSKEKIEQKIFREIEKEQEQERHLEHLRKKGYRF
jgi:hypothetical protein